MTDLPDDRTELSARARRAAATFDTAADDEPDDRTVVIARRAEAAALPTQPVTTVADADGTAGESTDDGVGTMGMAPGPRRTPSGEPEAFVDAPDDGSTLVARRETRRRGARAEAAREEAARAEAAGAGEIDEATALRGVRANPVAAPTAGDAAPAGRRVARIPEPLDAVYRARTPAPVTVTRTPPPPHAAQPLVDAVDVADRRSRSARRTVVIVVAAASVLVVFAAVALAALLLVG